MEDESTKANGVAPGGDAAESVLRQAVRERLAAAFIEAFKKRQGVKMNVAMFVQPDEVEWLVAGEHPELPSLAAIRASDRLKTDGFNTLQDVFFTLHPPKDKSMEGTATVEDPAAMLGALKDAAVNISCHRCATEYPLTSEEAAAITNNESGLCPSCQTQGAESDLQDDDHSGPSGDR